ncbi:MAG: hypothetical protein IT289_11370 [Oligoflexia bacterium]|nr:hypothetical protein [Oligoflexia bacterium]
MGYHCKERATVAKNRRVFSRKKTKSTKKTSVRGKYFFGRLKKKKIALPVYASPTVVGT